MSLLDDVRRALAGQEAWLVGGALRDRILGRELDDIDIALAGDPKAAARTVARVTGGAPFALSDAFGAWRVVARDHSWQVDLVPLQGGGLEADLAYRDFTINAIAEPLAGGARVDPHGGEADLAARCVRVVSPQAFVNDPLRVLRAVRLAIELSFDVEPATADAARAQAPGLRTVAGERVFAELRRVVVAYDPVAGMRLMDELGVTEHVLGELLAMRGVEQNPYHHLDVAEHTLAVLEAAVAIDRDPTAAGFTRHAEQLRALFATPLSDHLTHAEALRFAALLHDVAKPQTREEREGRITFFGHDKAGAEVAGEMLRRLRASERLVGYVSALVRHHLKVGFLVHERPITPRLAWRFMRATAPYAADVVVLTVADRLATLGRKADVAVAAHIDVAQALLDHVFAYKPQPPLVRGDEVARALGRVPGPWLGEVLEQIEEDRYAGELSTAEEALERARAIAGAL